MPKAWKKKNLKPVSPQKGEPFLETGLPLISVVFSNFESIFATFWGH